MERIAINPDRLAWCCADYGIAISDLAVEAGISPITLDHVMDGEAALTFNQLVKIADYFNSGVLFFLEQSPVIEDQIHSLAFRTLANQKPELTAKLKGFIERVEKQRVIYLALREEQDKEEITTFDPPDLPAKDIHAASKIARRWLQLDAENNFETYRTAVEKKGILVFRSNGYNGKWQISKENPILGFTLYDTECPVIVVKKMESDAQQAFTLMHEMGHLLLHKASSIDDENDLNSKQGLEREANAFAGMVLVPDEFLQKIDDDKRPAEVDQYDQWLSWCKRSWGVSVEVVLRRLLDSGRLPQKKYTEYRAWRDAIQYPQNDGGTRQYRHREPKHIFGDIFVRAVLGALSNRRITLTKASSYLDGLKINDLHQLERHYANL